MVREAEGMNQCLNTPNKASFPRSAGFQVVELSGWPQHLDSRSTKSWTSFGVLRHGFTAI